MAYVHSGYYFFIDKSNSQNDFKSNVFKHITSIKNDFDFKKVPELVEIVETLLYQHDKQYSVEYDGEIFEFIALDKPE